MELEDLGWTSGSKVVYVEVSNSTIVYTSAEKYHKWNSGKNKSGTERSLFSFSFQSDNCWVYLLPGTVLVAVPLALGSSGFKKEIHTKKLIRLHCSKGWLEIFTEYQMSPEGSVLRESLDDAWGPFGFWKLVTFELNLDGNEGVQQVVLENIQGSRGIWKETQGEVRCLELSGGNKKAVKGHHQFWTMETKLRM